MSWPWREGPLLEVRILPDTKELAPRTLREFLPKASQYVRYARAVLTNDKDVWRSSAQALRQVGATRRAAWARTSIASSRKTTRPGIAEGEPYPVKALADMHQVGISTASRWVKGARDAKLIPPKEAKDAGYTERFVTKRPSGKWAARWRDELGAEQFRGGFDTKTAAREFVDAKVDAVEALRRGDVRLPAASRCRRSANSSRSTSRSTRARRTRGGR